MNTQHTTPTKKFFTDLNAAAASLQPVQLPITNIKVQDASICTLRIWYKDGNARTYHFWKQEIPNAGSSIDELTEARVDQQYAFERAEKFLREGVDQLGRRHFYHARTAILYENINDSEVLRFVYQKQLYKATLHYGTSTNGHRWLASIVHFNKRGEPMPTIVIPREQIAAHRQLNLEFCKQKFLQANAKPAEEKKTVKP